VVASGVAPVSRGRVGLARNCICRASFGSRYRCSCSLVLLFFAGERRMSSSMVVTVLVGEKGTSALHGVSWSVEAVVSPGLITEFPLSA
jgi:hypothetical protein